MSRSGNNRHSPGGVRRGPDPSGLDLAPQGVHQGLDPRFRSNTFPLVGDGAHGGMAHMFGNMQGGQHTCHWAPSSMGEEGATSHATSQTHGIPNLNSGTAGKPARNRETEWERGTAGDAPHRRISTSERRRRKRIPTLLRKLSSTEPSSPCRPHRPSFRVQPIHDEATFASCELNGPSRATSTSPSGAFFDHNWSESTSPSTSCTGCLQGTMFSGALDVGGEEGGRREEGGGRGEEDGDIQRVDSLSDVGNLSQEVTDAAAQEVVGKKQLVIDTSKKSTSPFMRLEDFDGPMPGGGKSTEGGRTGGASFSFPVTPQSEEIVSFVSVDTQASAPFNSLTIEDSVFSPFLPSEHGGRQASGWNSPDAADGPSGGHPSTDVSRPEEAGMRESFRGSSEMEYSPSGFLEAFQPRTSPDASHQHSFPEASQHRGYSEASRQHSSPDASQQYAGGGIVDDSWEVINLKIYHKKGATGFEMSKDLQVRPGNILAGRYRVINELDTAAFSYAVSAEDLQAGQYVCLKIIKNNKDYFDQSLDEIKLLRMINNHDPNNEAGIVCMYDCFYYKEHLIIVFELLHANLYSMHRRCLRLGLPTYFCPPRIQTISRQILKATAFLHSLDIIHADLKPENVLIQSLDPCRIKIIDLGSSCFTTDHLGSYIQSRAYRSPEVILGLPYCEKIDVWSIGCVVAEMATGYALFQSDYAAGVLACMESLLGPLPALMQAEGKYSANYYTRSGRIYHQNPSTQQYEVLQPLPTDLRSCLETDDQLFLDFLSFLLVMDPAERPSAEEALRHPWLRTELGCPPQVPPGL